MSPQEPCLEVWSVEYKLTQGFLNLRKSSNTHFHTFMLCKNNPMCCQICRYVIIIINIDKTRHTLSTRMHKHWTHSASRSLVTHQSVMIWIGWTHTHACTHIHTHAMSDYSYYWTTADTTVKPVWNNHLDRQTRTDGQTDRQTDRQITLDRQTDRQTDRHADRQL